MRKTKKRGAKRFKEGHKGKKLNALKIFAIIILCCGLFFICKWVLGKNFKKQEENIILGNQVGDVASIIENTVLEENEKQDEIVSTEDMPKKMGIYDVVGKIVIDKINVKQYILDRTTNNALDLAVTKFTGPEINTEGNFCITGHNYKGIFRELKTLEKGDEFYLVGTDGRKVTYVVYDIFSIDPVNEDCLNQDTNGKREVTLITCNPGAVTRLIIKAEEK